MNQLKTKYTIYWMVDNNACYEESDDMNYVLKRVEELRKTPSYHAICFVAENPNQVGKMGVDAVVDGKTPDGFDYTWVKRRHSGQ